MLCLPLKCLVEHESTKQCQDLVLEVEVDISTVAHLDAATNINLASSLIYRLLLEHQSSMIWR